VSWGCTKEGDGHLKSEVCYSSGLTVLYFFAKLQNKHSDRNKILISATWFISDILLCTNMCLLILKFGDSGSQDVGMML